MADVEVFRAAQTDRLTALHRGVLDRPAHARYLRALLAADVDDAPDVEIPRGCSVRVAAAIEADVDWCRKAPPRPGWHSGGYPDEYRRRRQIDMIAARDRRVTREHGATWGALGNLGRILYGGH